MWVWHQAQSTIYWLCKWMIRGKRWEFSKWYEGNSECSVQGNNKLLGEYRIDDKETIALYLEGESLCASPGLHLSHWQAAMKSLPGRELLCFPWPPFELLMSSHEIIQKVSLSASCAWLESLTCRHHIFLSLYVLFYLISSSYIFLFTGGQCPWRCGESIRCKTISPFSAPSTHVFPFT